MKLRHTRSHATRLPLARRTFLIGAVALTTTTMLAGCGAGGGTSAAGGGDTLTVVVEAGGHGELQPIADAFTKQTGTTIQFVELPYDGLYNRLNSEFSSGSVSFDVAALDAIWLPAFADAVTPVNDLYTDAVVSDLFPALVTEAKVGENYVGLPAWTNSEILYYRKDLFEDPAQQAAFKAKYGYDLAPPKTWQQYTDAAAFFTQDTNGDGTPDLYGTDVKGAVETEWLATLSQTGETTMVTDAAGQVSLGDADSKKALDFYTSLLPYAPPGAAQLDWAGAQNLFNQGQTAMMRFWAHAYRQIPADATVAGKVGVAPMIGGDAGPAGVPGAWYLSIPKASPKQDKAKAFLQFAYDNNELSAATTLGLAARISVLEKYQTVAGYENYKPLLETLNASATRPRPAVAQWQQIVDTVLVPMLQKAVEPGADNQQLLDEAKQQVESLVGK